MAAFGHLTHAESGPRWRLWLSTCLFRGCLRISDSWSPMAEQGLKHKAICNTGGPGQYSGIYTPLSSQGIPVKRLFERGEGAFEAWLDIGWSQCYPVRCHRLGAISDHRSSWDPGTGMGVLAICLGFAKLRCQGCPRAAQLAVDDDPADDWQSRLKMPPALAAGWFSESASTPGEPVLGRAPESGLGC